MNDSKDSYRRCARLPSAWNYLPRQRYRLSRLIAWRESALHSRFHSDRPRDKPVANPLGIMALEKITRPFVVLERPGNTASRPFIFLVLFIVVPPHFVIYDRTNKTVHP